MFESSNIGLSLYNCCMIFYFLIWEQWIISISSSLNVIVVVVYDMERYFRAFYVGHPRQIIEYVDTLHFVVLPDAYFFRISITCWLVPENKWCRGHFITSIVKSSNIYMHTNAPVFPELCTACLCISSLSSPNVFILP